jgi:hypothetical protein
LAVLVSTQADRVQDWLQALTLDEKLHLLHGQANAHGFTGFVPGVKRLGIPNLVMNDGPQGFRGPKGTSTAWPCGLALAASFDPELVHAVAKATGKEFLAKVCICACVYVCSYCIHVYIELFTYVTTEFGVFPQERG